MRSRCQMSPRPSHSTDTWPETSSFQDITLATFRRTGCFILMLLAVQMRQLVHVGSVGVLLWSSLDPVKAVHADSHSEATEEEPQEDEEVAETSPAPVKKDKRGSQKSQVLPGLRCCLISINQLKHVRKFCIILFCSILHMIHPLHVLHSTAMRCAIPFPWKTVAFLSCNHSP